MEEGREFSVTETKNKESVTHFYNCISILLHWR